MKRSRQSWRVSLGKRSEVSRKSAPALLALALIAERVLEIAEQVQEQDVQIDEKGKASLFQS